MKIMHALFVFCLMPALGLAATIYVPDDYATIQGAIDASSDYDTIVVRAGAWVENIDFIGKEITLKSEQGASATTIDGNQADSVVTFQNGEDSSTSLIGFTITNGKATRGGGIYCEDTSPNIISNYILGNTATIEGGGIFCEYSSPDIEKNLILDNTSQVDGGGIYCWWCSPKITDNTIVENTAICFGGGITLFSSTPTIKRNSIIGNTAFDSGGGIFCGDIPSPTISHNIISGNIAHNEGGGICCDDSDPDIAENLLFENIANDLGGGICCHSCNSTISKNIIENNIANLGGGVGCTTDSQSTIVSNVIAGNTAILGGGIGCRINASPDITNNKIGRNVADDYGGGIYCQYSEPMITNNTVIENTADLCGGGMHFDNVFYPDIANTILWGNDALVQGAQLCLLNNSVVTIDFSDVEGGQSSCYVESGSTIDWGAGMIDVDPLFADAANDDFHLTWDSPCREAGDNSVVTESYDFEGDPRIALGTADMGADEYYYHLYHMGEVVPGSPVDIKVVGYPTAPVTLYLGSGLADPPYSTQHGDFFLNWPPLWQGNIGTVPGSGILSLPITVPSNWSTGEEHPLQSLVGLWGGPWTLLTNYEVLKVE